MRVFECQLGLADTAQPVQRPRQDDRWAVAGQVFVEPVQDRLAPGEVGVPSRDVRDPRDRLAAKGSIGTWRASRPGLPQRAQRVQYLQFQASPGGEITNDQAGIA